MKKMLAILASPRKKGNAAKMLNRAVDKAKKCNYDVTYIDLYEKEFTYCKGCMACKQTISCIIDDEIHEIEKHLKESDLVVVSSPSYFANVPAPLKNMFDRLCGFVMDDNKSMIPKPRLSSKQEYVIMVTCNTPAPFDRLAGQSTNCVKAIKEFFHVSGMKFRGKVVFAGTRGKNKIPYFVEKKINTLIR